MFGIGLFIGLTVGIIMGLIIHAVVESPRKIKEARHGKEILPK